MLRLTVALSLLLYPIPVGVAAAPVPQLSFAATVMVLQLRSPPVLVVLLRLRDLAYHWYPPGGLLLRLLLLLPRLPLVAAPPKRQLSLRWLMIFFTGLLLTIVWMRRIQLE